MAGSSNAMPPIKTWGIFVLSVFVGALITLLCFGLIGAFLLDSVSGPGWTTSTLLKDLQVLFSFSILTTVVMSVPALLFGIPTYMKIEAYRGIRLKDCLIFGGVVSTLTGAILLRIMVFSQYGAPWSMYLMFLVGGVVAGFVFHRLEKGSWT